MSESDRLDMDEISRRLEASQVKPQPECKGCKMFSSAVLCAASIAFAALNVPEALEKPSNQIQKYDPKKGYVVKSSYSKLMTNRRLAGLKAFVLAPIGVAIGINSYFELFKIDKDFFEKQILDLAKNRVNHRFNNWLLWINYIAAIVSCIYLM